MLEALGLLVHVVPCDADHVRQETLDQPVALRVKSGRMIAIPYQQGLNDIRTMFHEGTAPKDWLQMVRDQFDTLYAEGATQPRVTEP